MTSTSLAIAIERDRKRAELIRLALLRQTAGKNGVAELPAVRQAWADSLPLTCLGGLLLGAASVAWILAVAL